MGIKEFFENLRNSSKGNRESSPKMKFKIPLTFGELDKLKKRSAFFKKYIKHKKDTQLQKYLDIGDSGLRREDFLAICYRGFLLSFAVFFVFISTFFFALRIRYFILLAFVVSLVFSFMLFSSRIMYPKIFTTRKERDIERNLISALDDMLVQLNSGIPLFTILINISLSDYGELSWEFKKAVRMINAGIPESQVLEQIGERNSSLFFRRTLWQISNGMKAGGDISVIIRESVHALTEEQLIEIQNYGNKLNPMIMFYMLVSVIIPALSITFLTVLSSIVNLEKTTTTVLFVSLFVIVLFFQVMFLGIIKSVRPRLL